MWRLAMRCFDYTCILTLTSSRRRWRKVLRAGAIANVSTASARHTPRDHMRRVWAARAACKVDSYAPTTLAAAAGSTEAASDDSCPSLKSSMDIATSGDAERADAGGEAAPDTRGSAGQSLLRSHAERAARRRTLKCCRAQ